MARGKKARDTVEIGYIVVESEGEKQRGQVSKGTKQRGRRRGAEAKGEHASSQAVDVRSRSHQPGSGHSTSSHVRMASTDAS